MNPKESFIENRAAAAAWLYKNTGEQAYIDQLKADLAAKNITASTNNLGESQWAVWAYVTIDRDRPFIAAHLTSRYMTTWFRPRLNDAEINVTNAIDQRIVPCEWAEIGLSRYGTDRQRHPGWNLPLSP